MSREAVSELDLTASRVAYLVDGDEAGKRRRTLLVEAGVPAERIVMLGGGRTTVVLEDLLAPEVYRAAVNAELVRWHTDIELPATAIPRIGRPKTVERWCEKNGIEPPGKRAVAHQVVDQRRMRDLLDPKRRVMLQRLNAKLDALLVRPSHQPS